jgi:hypothetical protein
LKWDSTVPQVLRDGKAISIVFLPDLDEKYVVSVQGGLGTAASKVALGPGGTANQFEANVDNREVGRFIFDEVAKFTDLAVDLIKVKNKLLAKVADVGETETELVDKQPVPAVLRYIYVGFAVPGMYPILKNSEYGPLSSCVVCPGQATFSTQDPFLRGAQWPFTRYSVRLRREFVLYIEDFTRPPTPEEKTARKAQGDNDFKDFCKQIPKDLPIQVSIPRPPAVPTAVTLTVSIDGEGSLSANDGKVSTERMTFAFKSTGFVPNPVAKWTDVYDDVGKPLIDAAVREAVRKVKAMDTLGAGSSKVLKQFLDVKRSEVVVREPQVTGNGN